MRSGGSEGGLGVGVTAERVKRDIMMMPKLHREDLEDKAARHTLANTCYGGGWGGVGGAGRVDEYEESITVYPCSHSFFLTFFRFPDVGSSSAT